VQRIVGPGAAWPQLNRQQIIEEVTMTVKAGSSGRPNSAAELAKMERAMPWLQQMNGISMAPFGEKACHLLDIDAEEAVIEGLPSQVALNAMAGKLAQQGAAGAAPVSDDPNAQGGAGGDNAEKPMENEPGPQPAYPTVNYDQQGNPMQ